MFLDAPNRSYASRRLAKLPLVGLLAFVFSAGLVAGTVMLRPHAIGNPGGLDDRRKTQADAPVWNRAGNPVARQPVEVLRTIDGDTFEARVHLWPGLEMTTRVRLRGIDAPELKARCAEEGAMAQNASDALRSLLDEGGVTIFNIGPDKYNGRVVADASTRLTPDVSAALLASGRVRSYSGGHRNGWCH